MGTTGFDGEQEKGNEKRGNAEPVGGQHHDHGMWIMFTAYGLQALYYGGLVVPKVWHWLQHHPIPWVM